MLSRNLLLSFACVIIAVLTLATGCLDVIPGREDNGVINVDLDDENPDTTDDGTDQDQNDGNTGETDSDGSSDGAGDDDTSDDETPPDEAL